ncbi:unnamed protein product [Protopolystoma xenopodis]|uniref:Uncharacterized protein n=1 Tax=Protopolystoma xenopodis TaxID=117903 RepID=A0A3S5CIA1_9PLAT|nr:unnamed protein product [Protopolystoma xenopodis]
MNRIMDERDSMAEAASTASHEAAIAIANLVLMQQELHQVSKKLDYEANASKCSNDARLAAIGKLNEAHLELASLRELITKTQQERDDASKCAKDLSDQLVFNIKSHSSERHALKETIKILTDYLSSVSSEFGTSLKAKLQSEKELALCRGGIRGLVDRYRFFSHLDNYEKDCMTSTNLSKEVNQTTTSSTGLTLIDLEGLLEESDDHPLVQSK